ncbi:MAG: hypothetical protein D6766_05380 [Verrucomicrobia bacterium]|nr:MAG: hypothetical protein D6766_05380 [Verrucomicrobiota bacterium]
MLLAAMAGGMGWGIRGQYGHETGAMMAGLLVALTLACRWCARWDALATARVVAWATIATGFGGSMTYGQTLGLTQNAELIGRGDALAWGLLGTTVKGGVWIGFTGLFLGMGLGGVDYRPRQVLGAMLVALGCFALGVWLLNEPYDPAYRRLPAIYFSATWEWYPQAGPELRPRREVWGGLWLAWLALWGWAGWWRRDRLARRLALWGVLGGGAGFTLGQALQAWHAWHPAWFEQSWLAPLTRHFNWWNLMETTFGFVWGGVVAWGVARNRAWIRPPGAGALRPAWTSREEFLWLILHVGLLVPGTLADWWLSDAYLEVGLCLGLLPLVAVRAGRWWPWAMVMPVTLLPITLKTVRQLAFQEETVSVALGAALYGVVPMLMACGLMVWAFRLAARGAPAGRVFPWLWLAATWIYFALNFAYFHYPWPWRPWTSRTPHGLVFLLFAIGSSVGAWRAGKAELWPARETAEGEPGGD